MNISFYLKGSSIYIDVKWPKCRVRKSTGEKCLPKDWIEKDKQGKVIQKVNPRVTGSQDINYALDDIKEKVEKAFRKYRLENISPLEQQIEDVLTSKPEPEKLTFYKFFDQVLLVDPDKDRMTTTYNHLKRFNPKLDFKDITDQFFQDFVAFLAKGKMDKETKEYIPMVNNSIGTQINKIKKLCRKADKKGLMLSKDWEDYEVFKEKTKKYTVSDKEIMDVYNREYLDPRVRKSVDLFVFRFYAGGLRHSDSQILKEESIINVMVNGKLAKGLQYAQKKTQAGNCVLLNKVCLEILKKYENLLPKMTSQECNRFLKIAFRAAGHKEKVVKIRHSGKERIETVHEMWELLGKSHTARYSAVRMIVEKTGNIYLAKEIVGHSDIKTTQGYMEFDEDFKHSEYLKVIG